MLPGKAMFEVKRPNVSKGDGVRELMTHPPFAGRMPVFIGDDVTDESVFAVLPELGGKGFSVGRHFAGLAGIFDSPKEVRRALQRLAANGQARPVMSEFTLDLAVIGNGRTAALVEPSGRIVWWCLPRYDGDPVFCRLLAGDEEKGFTDVVLDGQVETRSDYMRNTAIVVTELTDGNGGAVRITDFAPRFQHYGRTFRPPQLVRIIEPIAGMPRITIRFRTTHRYGVPVTTRSSGSNSIRYWRDDVPVRLTTDAPLSYVENEASFVLTRPVHMVMGVDEPFEGALESTCREFCDRTRDYWMEWVRRLAFSIDWQDEIIRAGITLKLCNFEETGAIVAALTTSIPEGPGSGRNWDYRYLLDARRLLRGARAQPHRRDAHDGGFHLLHPEHRRRPRRPAQAALRRGAHRYAGGAHRGGARRLQRRRAGAHRQCRGRSGPARRLWQHHHGGDADVLRPPAAEAGRRRAVPGDRAARRAGGAGSRSSRTPAFGNIAAASACTLIRRRCAGPAASGWRRSRPISVCRSARHIGATSPAGSARRCCSAPGIPSARRFRRPSTATISTPAACCWPNSA